MIWPYWDYHRILPTRFYLNECDNPVSTLSLDYTYMKSNAMSLPSGEDESGRCEEVARSYARTLGFLPHATVFYVELIFLDDDHDGHSTRHSNIKRNRTSIDVASTSTFQHRPNAKKQSSGKEYDYSEKQPRIYLCRIQQNTKAIQQPNSQEPHAFAMHRATYKT